MKKLQNLEDKKSIYIIEAVRVSFLMIKQSYDDLNLRLNEFKDDKNEFDIRLYINAWSMIDSLHRFGDCIKDVRGLSHKDIRYDDFNKNLFDVNKIRNYVHHLSSPKSLKSIGNDDSYPVLGALSWSFDGEISRTISFSTLPIGAMFNTLGYNTEEGKFIVDIKFGCVDFEISLMQCFKQADMCYEYFDEYLKSKSFLSDDELEATKLISGKLNIPHNSKKFIRMKIKISAQQGDAPETGSNE